MTAPAAALVKCLVWDLDNTLWQGTLLEDADVRLPEAVREMLIELDSRGILQSISSKNDHDLAWSRLEELGIAQYFVLPKIGWGHKSDSVREIARQLRFAPETIAFVDDQAVERAHVAFHLPAVRCYSAEQLPSLADRAEFSPTAVTGDSRQRRRMYQAGFRRAAEQAAFTGPDEDFLRSLRLVMHISRADQADLARVEELTLRTSQMNATGVHYSDATLRGLLADRGHEVLVITMTDRLGPHGAVGVVLLERQSAVWHLKLLATSCRVVSLGAGAVILNWLTSQAAAAGAHLVADFRPTTRNRMMEIAYRFSGFAEEPCACLAGLTVPGDGAGLQRLHLIPVAQGAPATMQVVAPSLAGHRG